MKKLTHVASQGDTFLVAINDQPDKPHQGEELRHFCVACIHRRTSF